MKRILFLSALMNIFSISAMAQSKTFTFPQFADGIASDGSFYRSTLMISPWFSSDGPNCTLTLRGISTDFGKGLGTIFNFTIPTGNVFVTNTSANQPLKTGYATLLCSTDVFAQVLYSFYAANGTKLSEATVFGTQPDFSTRLIFDYREGARLGIAIANDTDQPHVYTFTNGSTIVNVTIQPRSSMAKFLDQIIVVGVNQVSFVKITSADFSQFSVMGLRYTGVAFTTIPATSFF